MMAAQKKKKKKIKIEIKNKKRYKHFRIPTNRKPNYTGFSTFLVLSNYMEDY